MSYGFTSDNNISPSGYIDKSVILSKVSEEEIYELVFGFKPEEYQYCVNPLRVDRHPGCWFERTSYGLVFRDFGYSNKPLDCFEMVQRFFKLPNFYASLKFINEALILGKPSRERICLPSPEEREVEIYCASRRFKKHDGAYWNPYQISKKNLIDDKVFPVSRIQMIGTKKGDFDYNIKELAYVYTDFKGGRKKLYFPKRTSSSRFITNCIKNDIGGITRLSPYGSLLIITKSYKDYRVLLNQGKSVIWIQNEGMIPDTKILVPILKRFSRVVVFYDNDKQGIEASNKLSQIINKYFPGKSSPMWLDEGYLKFDITDPSDLIKETSREELNKILSKL